MSSSTSNNGSLHRKTMLGLGAVAIAGATFGATPTLAAEHVVEMLNQGPGGAMVFEPSFVKAEVGDTVVFKPAQAGGHNSKSTLVPDGAEMWNTAPDTETKIELSVEGVYVYVCQPHLVMGMSGVIQVGAASNLEAAKASAAQTSATFALNKDRLTTALAQVQ
ncbi:MAG: plastocyanin/azurin family copper-binding protein [Pseudomonadota bacterium]